MRADRGRYSWMALGLFEAVMLALGVSALGLGGGIVLALFGIGIAGCALTWLLRERKA